MQSDPSPVFRNELIRRLERSHAVFDALLGRMTGDQLNGLPVVGHWVMKDVLAHFIAHEQHVLDEIRLARRGHRVDPDYGDTDTFNEGAVSAWRGESLAEVRRAWEVSRRQVVTLVNDLPDDAFDPSGRVVAALGDTIDGALANNTYEHYAEHGPQIGEAIGERAVPRIDPVSHRATGRCTAHLMGDSPRPLFLRQH